jgi:hypothetical protein
MSEIFSEKVLGGRRTYFFDVKETKDGSKYLVIGELTQVGDDLERHRVMVFEENLESFRAGLEKAIEFVKSEADGAGERDHLRGSQEEFCSHCGAEINDGGGDDIKEALDRIERGVEEIRKHFN